MMRSLWTGASGMIAQQNSVDTISNNLSNVNTTGYKKETVEFKTLLYSKLQTKTTDNNGDPKPVIGQVGAGVRTASITSRFTQGNMQSTGNTLDFALDGSGFFQVQLGDGSIAYTRNGAFSLSMGVDGLTLCTSDGEPVLSSTGEPIVIDLSIPSITEGYQPAAAAQALKALSDSGIVLNDAYMNPSSISYSGILAAQDVVDAIADEVLEGIDITSSAALNAAVEAGTLTTEQVRAIRIINTWNYNGEDADGNPISVQALNNAAYSEMANSATDVDSSRISIDEDGRFWYRRVDDEMADLGIKFGIVQFNNPTGLEKLSGSLLAVTGASGEARLEDEDAALKKTKVRSKYLEGSNVETVDEMVNLIVAQRAYEMNSKVITASDEMLQQANNLRQ